MNTKLRCVAGPSLIYIQHQLYFPNKNVLVPGIWYDVFGAFCKIEVQMNSIIALL